MLDRLARSRYAFPAAILAIAAIAGIVVLIVQSGGTAAARRGGHVRAGPGAGPGGLGLEAPKGRLDAQDLHGDREDELRDVRDRAGRRGGAATTASFVRWRATGSMTGLSFHRIAPGFVIQGGDPNGDGTGGPGYKTRDTPPDDVVYSEGVVAMAKGGDEPAGTGGSQFFVVTRRRRPAARLRGARQGRGRHRRREPHRGAGGPQHAQQGGPPAGARRDARR